MSSPNPHKQRNLGTNVPNMNRHSRTHCHLVNHTHALNDQVNETLFLFVEQSTAGSELLHSEQELSPYCGTSAHCNFCGFNSVLE